jgi:hypothetical protein
MITVKGRETIDPIDPKRGASFIKRTDSKKVEVVFNRSQNIVAYTKKRTDLPL